MVGWHDDEFRERLRAVIQRYTDGKAKRWRAAQTADEYVRREPTKILPGPKAPRLPMHR